MAQWYALQEWWTALADLLNEQGFSRDCPRGCGPSRRYDYATSNVLDGQALLCRCDACGGETVVLARTLGAPFLPPYGGPAAVDLPRFVELLATLGVPSGTVDASPGRGKRDPRWRGWLPFPAKGNPLRRSPQHRYSTRV